MADAVVSFAIEKLADFVKWEVNIRIGVKDALLWLKDELGYLLISVRDAEDKQGNEIIRQWIGSVIDVANEAVILMERFSVLQEEQAEHGVLDRLRSCICICKKEAYHYDIGKELESLKEKVIGIKNRRHEYGIDDILAGHYRHQEEREKIRKLRRTNAIEHQEEVVGFEDDVKTLLAVLLSDDPSLGLISIHGMGGLGKTTLARKLYNSSELMRHFDYRAWVCVSESYDITHVLKVIISSMGHELNSLNNMDYAELFQHLRNLMIDRRFLVVIDDIWDIEVWKMLAYAYPDMKNGSRIVLTTRSLRGDVAVGDKCFVHQLRFLREDESWHLFCIRAKPTIHMEKLAREIVHECRGLPLAIVVLSGLLSTKRSYEEWSDVKYHLWRHLRNGSLAIEEILSLSYDDLSSEMRQCFLYLARFPEDYTFAVDKLKMLWIAEEFISEAYEEDGIVMEDVAEDFLNELISRNLIQIVSLGGQVSLCCVHDLVRDFALDKAREHKVLGIFDSSKQHPSPISLLHGQPRHVIYNGVGEYLKFTSRSCDNSMLRSLITNTVEYVELEEMKLIYTRFKYLKVLDLTGLESNKIPEEIGGLVLLKFLGLTGNISSKPLIVPQTIGKLRKLQTLFGSVNSRYEFPREISEQKELRHLKFAQAVVNLKIGSTQTKLQSLETIQYSDWIHIDTVNFTNLYTLSITDDASLNISYGLNSLANLTCLQTVTLNFLASPILPTIKPLLFCKRIKNVTLKGTIKDPSELSFLPDSVTDLTLCSSKFTQDPMPILGSLLNLIHLHMDNVYTGKIMVCRDAEFPSLQTLNVKDLPNLEEWQVEDGALPSLKTFQINGCANLKIIPAQLKFGSSL